MASRIDAIKIIKWMAREGNISEAEIAAIVEYPSISNDQKIKAGCIPIIGFNELCTRLTPMDMVMVAGQRLDQAISDLFALGINNIFDGQEVLASLDLGNRFIRIAAPYHIGANYPILLDESKIQHLRYTGEPIDVHRIPGNKLFVVNSVPKSGTIWMMAMLEILLGIKSKQQITLSHVMDITEDSRKPNVHGAVVLVRDLRDVVVSWFHDLARCDLHNGFSEPRYTTITEFYFNHLIGLLSCSRRYAFGNLENWLNLATSHGFPLVRYEDLVQDTPYWLHKVINSWKISVPEQAIADAARQLSFHEMQQTFPMQQGYISNMMKSGHLRKGMVGAWKTELPPLVAEDIDRRFSAYQQRLRYDL
ncbi:sulfotransferase domain-containing protein [Halomonas sp. BN3-1]|uniref:sulfotransferase domain-containing protein n=1 Tax=Halomonas sp. BN3-1 TaxID=2082393 RepID=UPI0013B438C2|nr:sulfotransferase domain-containing protein [Halomonas sp. BN3-1]